MEKRVRRGKTSCIESQEAKFIFYKGTEIISKYPNSFYVKNLRHTKNEVSYPRTSHRSTFHTCRTVKARTEAKLPQLLDDLLTK